MFSCRSGGGWTVCVLGLLCVVCCCCGDVLGVEEDFDGVCGVVWCVVGSVVFNKCGGGGKWVRVILGPDPHISL